MTDIIELLRDSADKEQRISDDEDMCGVGWRFAGRRCSLLRDAAAEIERLRAERDQALADIDHIWDVPMGRYGDVGMDDSSPSEAMNSILDHAENLQCVLLRDAAAEIERLEEEIERLQETLWQITQLAELLGQAAREALGLDEEDETL